MKFGCPQAAQIPNFAKSFNTAQHKSKSSFSISKWNQILNVGFLLIHLLRPITASQLFVELKFNQFRKTKFLLFISWTKLKMLRQLSISKMIQFGVCLVVISKHATFLGLGCRGKKRVMLHILRKILKLSKETIRVKHN